MTAQPSFWRLLGVCFTYAKKRGRGADFGELAPSDLSQNFQACIFCRWWNLEHCLCSGEGLFPPFSLSSEGLVHEGRGCWWEPLGWWPSWWHEWGKGNNTQVARTTQCFSQHWDSHWAMQGPHLWEDIVGLNCTTRLEFIPTLQACHDNYLELSTCVRGYLWQCKMWNQQHWEDTATQLCIIITNDGAYIS